MDQEDRGSKRQQASARIRLAEAAASSDATDLRWGVGEVTAGSVTSLRDAAVSHPTAFSSTAKYFIAVSGEQAWSGTAAASERYLS